MSDDDGAVSIATLVITVAGRNDTPIAANDTASAAENGLSVSIDVLANDSDADQEDTPSTLNVDLIEPPAAASGATVTATGLPGAPIIYDPSSTVAFDSLGVGQTTTDVITYRAVDGHDAASNVATVRITITGVNDNPVSFSWFWSQARWSKPPIRRSHSKPLSAKTCRASATTNRHSCLLAASFGSYSCRCTPNNRARHGAAYSSTDKAPPDLLQNLLLAWRLAQVLGEQRV